MSFFDTADNKITKEQFLEAGRFDYYEPTFTYYLGLSPEYSTPFFEAKISEVIKAEQEMSFKPFLREIFMYMETEHPYFYGIQFHEIDIGARNPTTRDILDS